MTRKSVCPNVSTSCQVVEFGRHAGLVCAVDCRQAAVEAAGHHAKGRELSEVFRSADGAFKWQHVAWHSQAGQFYAASFRNFNL